MTNELPHGNIVYYECAQANTLARSVPALLWWSALATVPATVHFVHDTKISSKQYILSPQFYQTYPSHLQFEGCKPILHEVHTLRNQRVQAIC
jgi:hypothetical protein